MAISLKRIKTMSDMDLVNIVNETEGFAWRLNHDAADGRIPDKGVDASIKDLMRSKEAAIAEITRRTGITGHDNLKEYITNKLKEQNDLWDTQWAELCNEGAVFQHLKGDGSVLYETVRTYLPTHGTMGPKEFILARIRGTSRFVEFDDRYIPELIRPPSHKRSSLYTNMTPLERGLIKAHEEPAKRRRETVSDATVKDKWHLYDAFDHTLFHHEGFDELFEVVRDYNLPQTERCEENEVLLARSHARPVLVEFTPGELGLMKILNGIPRYKCGEELNLDK